MAVGPVSFDHSNIVQTLSGLLTERYIDLDVAENMAARLSASLPAYREIEDGPTLAQKVTEDLRSVSNDKHVRVRYQPDKAAYLRTTPVEDRPELWAVDAAADNYGFYRAEWLRGGIGYIDLRMFAPPEMGGDVAVATMSFLGNARALIFDLRRNFGGSPNMVQLLTTYLFDGETRHLTTFYTRYKDEYTQFWTLPHVPGKRLPNAHVYVLTSSQTFSGAEEFAYNLKAMERATLVGETTAGAANPGDSYAVSEHFTVFVPDGRAINAITQSNWEGTGVVPHVQTAAKDSFGIAHRLALEQCIEQARDQTERDLLGNELKALDEDPS